MANFVLREVILLTTIIFLLMQRNSSRRTVALKYPAKHYTIPAPSTDTRERMSVRIGLMMPWNLTEMKKTIAYVTTASAVVIALDRVNREQLLNNVEWQLFYKFPDCAEAVAGGIATSLYRDNNVDAIIGPPCSIAAVVAGIFGHYHNIPLVSWAATDPQLNDRKRFPTMARTIGSSQQLGGALMVMLEHMRWNEVALIFNDDAQRRKCFYVHLGFEEEIIARQHAKKFNVLVKHQVHVYGESPSDAEIEGFLLAIQTEARVIACLDKPEDRRRLMLAARRLQMDTDAYVYVLPDYFTDSSDRSIWLHHSLQDDDGNDADARVAFHKAISLEIQLDDTPELDNFRREIPQRMMQPPFNYTPKDDEQYGSVYSAFMHDAMYVYAMALNKTLTDELGRPGGNVTLAKRNGRTLIRNCKDMEFEGMSGHVVMDEFSSRVPSFVLRMFTVNGTYRPVAHLHMYKEPAEIIEMLIPEDQLWATRGGFKPLSHPKCGWDGELCVESRLPEVLTVMAFFACVLTGIIFFIMRRNRAHAMAIEKLTWLISRKELTGIKSAMSNAKSSRMSLSSMDTLKTVDSSQTSSQMFTQMEANTESYHFYVYKAVPCAVKVHAIQYPFKHETEQKEIRIMRSFDNANVNIFLGLCLDTPQVWSVWRFCSRGSLQDVFKNDNLRLDWYFKFSLINDCTEGVDYLFRSGLGSHGSLTSRNCLIDDRWRLKVSEYGLTPIKAVANTNPESQLWTAPELLRSDQSISLPLGTKKADIFSLGIIYSEILKKQKAFGEQHLSPDQIVNAIKAGTNPPFRPAFSNIDMIKDDPHNATMIRLMTECWDEKPEARPEMRTIKATLKMMMGGRVMNLMDHVLNMMERYASTLEAQISERTKALIEEQKKSDLLLSRLLPAAVAKVLKTGGQTEPELFAAATIFFSDVVGFTVIAGQSSPMQVVGLLNDLYSLFDAIIDQHDAYKVETIGDAYMIASGVPHRNGDQHAAEIADMALDFNVAISTFVIAHMPNKTLQVRIGMHTGSVVAGVVGLQMPRYCLFGDTVQIASLMESNGKPGQIQLTEETEKYLTSKIGGYQCECRGETLIKGKGVMTTYWLLKKTDGTEEFTNVSKFQDDQPIEARTTNPSS